MGEFTLGETQLPPTHPQFGHALTMASGAAEVKRFLRAQRVALAIPAMLCRNLAHSGENSQK